MNVAITLLLIGSILYFKVNSELSLSATSINPVTAEVNVEAISMFVDPECVFQCKKNDGTITECQCESGSCNTDCETDTVIGLSPGTLNTIYVNQRVSSNQWRTYSTSVEMPFVNYELNIIQVTRTSITVEVVPTNTSLYISDSCSISISDTDTQVFKDASCEGGCNPCTRFTVTSLTPATGYELRVLPNFARNPIFTNFRTHAYTYLLETTTINENNVTVRITRGDAPTSDTCNFLIIGKSDNIDSWKPPRCNHGDSCPNDCSSLLEITELVARVNYTLAMNSTGTPEEVRLEFTTGSVEYSGRITQKGFTWVVFEMSRIDGSKFDDDVCSYFITSAEFGKSSASCDTGQCPLNCISANITNLSPGTQYTLWAVPWKHGSAFYVIFFTNSVILEIKTANIYPTKINLDFKSNYEPRGNCSYRLLDNNGRYIPITCQPKQCPSDCMSVNVTGLLANKVFSLEVFNTYSNLSIYYTFRTAKVNYVIEQTRANISDMSFIVRADVDYRADVIEDCDLIFQTSTGKSVSLLKCNTPPCGNNCSNEEFVLSNLRSGQQYLLYMNSTFSDYEVSSFVYTVQADIFLEQKETTTDSIRVEISLNETANIALCGITLYDKENNKITPECNEGCSLACRSFTLKNLKKSQSYKVVIESSLKNTDTELIVYTLFESPRILGYNITSTSSLSLRWDYDFFANKDFVFTVFANNNSNGALLFGQAYYPPSVVANLVFLPPETPMTVYVCASPIRLETLTNCDNISVSIPLDIPEPLGSINITSITGQKLDVILPSITLYQGNIRECYVYSIYVLKESYLGSFKVPPQEQIKFDGHYFGYKGISGILQAKFTEEECRRTVSFQVGDGKVYNGIKNKPIRGDNFVSVFFRSCINSASCSDSSIPSPVYITGSNVSVYILVTLMLIILLIFVSYSLYIRFSNKAVFKINLKNDFFENTLPTTNENNRISIQL